MGINTSHISQADRDQLNNRDNPPEYDSDFDGSGGDDGFDSIDFDDFLGEDDFGGGSSGGSDIFGGNPSSPFGGNASINNSGGVSAFGNPQNNNIFGGTPTVGYGQTDIFGNPINGGVGQQQQQNQVKEDAFGKLYDNSVDAAKSLYNIVVDLIKSVRTRTADDLGYLSTQLIKYGAIISTVSIIVGIFGSIVGFAMIKFSALPSTMMIAGMITLSIGLISMGVASAAITRANTSVSNTSLDDLPDASSFSEFEDATDVVNDSIGAQLDDLFSLEDLDDLDEILGEDVDDIESNSTSEEEDVFIPTDEDLPPIDYAEALENIRENQLISREILVNTFIPMLPINTPKFADKKLLNSSDDAYISIRICVLKALARVTGTDLNTVESEIESIEDSFYSYTIMASRINKCNKLDEIAREVERYLRDDSSDTSVNATVTIEGDSYKIIVTKGETAVVTFGDAFKQSYVKDFYMNTKNKLPMIQGIDELGRVLLADAKAFDTMLVAGKPRSGKSWYVLSILMSLMMFNTPEDVQFVIVDPKESYMFKTLSLMPHVCGLHDNKRILQILDDIIEKEAPRRKKLFKDHRVDDIWALRDKGIKLPILYIVIDEYITVRTDLGDDYKELDRRLQVLISQLPSQGIRLLFVPHRATGIVDKTNRTMIQYAAAVKANNDEIIDTLDIKKWTRPLVNPGDIAIKSSKVPDGAYVRGAALTTSDGKNTELIENIAKAFYKMGVEIPDMGEAMSIACNRDENYVREELSLNGKIIQYDANNIFDELYDSNNDTIIK